MTKLQRIVQIEEHEQKLSMDRAIVDCIHYRRPYSLFNKTGHDTYNAS